MLLVLALAPCRERPRLSDYRLSCEADQHILVQMGCSQSIQPSQQEHLASNQSKQLPVQQLSVAVLPTPRVCTYTPIQARSEEENLGLQTQLDIAGSEVEHAHARLAALELEKERKNAQVNISAQPMLFSLRVRSCPYPLMTSPAVRPKQDTVRTIL